MIGWLRECGPWGGVLLAATFVLTVGLLSRRPWPRALALLLAVPFLVLCLQLARFDGQRHENVKFDATFFVWIRVVLLRMVAGVSWLALAAPLGIGAARWVGLRGRPLLGLFALGPLGAGLCASSIIVQVQVRDLLNRPLDERFARLEHAVAGSDAALWIGAGASMLALAVVAIGAWRAGSASPSE